MATTKYKVDDILQVCCAAFHMTGGYTNVRKYELAHVVKNTLGAGDYAEVPTCNVSETDIEMANEVKDYIIRHLTFSILAKEDKEQTLIQAIMNDEHEKYEAKVYTILQEEEIPVTKFKALVDLPEYYIKYRAFKEIKRKLKEGIVNKPLAQNHNTLYNLQCDVFHVMKTKNYDGYNITGIINDKLVSWYSTTEMPVGSYTISRATVKEFSHNFYANCMNTRMTSVKATKNNEN